MKQVHLFQASNNIYNRNHPKRQNIFKSLYISCFLFAIQSRSLGVKRSWYQRQMRFIKKDGQQKLHGITYQHKKLVNNRKWVGAFVKRQAPGFHVYKRWKEIIEQFNGQAFVTIKSTDNHISCIAKSINHQYYMFHCIITSHFTIYEYECNKISQCNIYLHMLKYFFLILDFLVIFTWLEVEEMVFIEQ